MLPYLHILIRVEDDGSLHALGAFTCKEKQLAYQKAAGLENRQVRLDFYNGPFDEDIKVVYAGHRHWNMDLFQLGGYFKSEGEAWTWVTQEGYVSILRIDTNYEQENALEQEAINRYIQLQRRWRLATYEELVKREGADKARANIKLRFYEDALESFKPKTRRDVRALYAFIVLILSLPLAIYFSLSNKPKYAENVDSVSWLPSYASDISYYRSRQVHVFEFKVSIENFRRWAGIRGMQISPLTKKEIVSRYKAYIPTPAAQSSTPPVPGGILSLEQFEAWQNDISAQVSHGLIAETSTNEIAIYDIDNEIAYYQYLISF